MVLIAIVVVICLASKLTNSMVVHLRLSGMRHIDSPDAISVRS
jgi:hypothetical protein